MTVALFIRLYNMYTSSSNSLSNLKSGLHTNEVNQTNKNPNANAKGVDFSKSRGDTPAPPKFIYYKSSAAMNTPPVSKLKEVWEAIKCIFSYALPTRISHNNLGET